MSGSVNSVEDIKTYKDYYPLLNADCFDAVMVEWDGVAVTLFVDDEGLMKSGNIGRTVKGYPQPLFGNIVVCGGVDERGNTLPLDEKIDIFNIDKYIGKTLYVIQ